MSKEKEKIKILIESLVDEVVEEGVFTDPITDIFKTASYGVKKIGATAGSNLTKILGRLYTTLIPWISYKESDRIAKEIDNKKKQKIASLDSQYKDVLERNYNAFTNRDIAGIFFLLRPGAYLTSKVGLSGASSALTLLGLLTSPFPNVVAKINDIKDRIDKINTTSVGWQGQGAGKGISGGMMGGYGDYGDFGSFDGGIYESKLLKEDNNIDAEIKALLKDPELIQALKNNKFVKELDRIDLSTIKERINQLNKINSLEDFKKFVSPEEFNELINKLKSSLKQKNINELIPEIKDLYKKSYVEILKNKLKNSSIPNEIEELIKKIQ